jgi:hypothetical protein
MPHSQHALLEEFPDRARQIQSMIVADAGFARNALAYSEVNGEILRIEDEVERTSDEYLETLKKKRLHLLDTIHGQLLNSENIGA